MTKQDTATEMPTLVTSGMVVVTVPSAAWENAMKDAGIEITEEVKAECLPRTIIFDRVGKHLYGKVSCHWTNKVYLHDAKLAAKKALAGFKEPASL